LTLWFKKPPAPARATPKGQPLTELWIIRTKTMTKVQRNDLCTSCHAKASPLTLEYNPGERFYDHFDLFTLEDPDYYATDAIWGRTIRSLPGA